jgi:uncharacterized protein YndB with AHSA1/START domain
VHVTRTVAAPLEHVWECLCSADGAQALLGDGAVLGSKGEPWHSGDGTHGVVRSYHPLEQLRVSWHAGQDDPPGLVDLHLSGDGSTTRLDLVHDRIGIDPASLEERWRSALDRVASLATT